MNEVTKEIVAIGKELLFKTRYALCLSITCGLMYLVRGNKEPDGLDFLILFLGTLAGLTWSIGCIFYFKEKIDEKKKKAGSEKAIVDLLNRMNPLEAYALVKLLSKNQDSGDYSLSEFSGAIHSLFSKGLIVKGSQNLTTGRQTITVMPEVWSILLARRIELIDYSNRLNPDRPL